jgi:hypothetical protein
MPLFGERNPGFGRGFLFVKSFSYRGRCALFPFKIGDVKLEESFLVSNVGKTPAQCHRDD